MEVHHHPHSSKRKTWRTHGWEFIMLFLAVFCGFLAEYKLEHTIERHREKEFIVSMIEDAKTDLINIEKALAANYTRAYKLDTLANLCYQYAEDGKAEGNIYSAFLPCVRHPDFSSPTERTLTQLKNAGGMRLIQNRTAANAITVYDDFGKKLVNQQIYYERYLNELLEHSKVTLNHKYFAKDPITLKLVLKDKSYYVDAKLISDDKFKIIEMGNHASVYKNIVLFYITRLQEGIQQSKDLIKVLKREYDVK